MRMIKLTLVVFESKLATDFPTNTEMSVTSDIRSALVLDSCEVLVNYYL